MKRKILLFIMLLLLIRVNLYAEDGGFVENNNPDIDSGELVYNSSGDDAYIDFQEAEVVSEENYKNQPPEDRKALDEETTIESASLLTLGQGGESSESGNVGLSDWTLKPVQVIPAGNTGAATISIPIIVPPGRKGIEPEISITYNSNTRNGWIGVGWTLDMGAIQRSTKRGVDYSANDYVAIVNGAVSELVQREEWGANYYGAKIEGTFTKYYYNSSTGGWEVTTKDGTKYYYGTTPASRQDNVYGVFKWCLDRVEDTNGNYMTITYWKGQGEIYINRIDYTGNTAGVSPTNYVKFYWESREDAPVMYTSNAPVKTGYRLKTIEVVANGSTVRAYKLEYDADPDTPGFQYSSNTRRSLLGSIQLYGTDVSIDNNGTIFAGSSYPPLIFGFEGGGSGFTDSFRGPAWSDAGGWDNPKYYSTIGYPDLNGDGKADLYARDSAGILCYETMDDGIELMHSISNAIGGTTTITYQPSSQYTNILLPFIVQTLSSVTVDDGNGVQSTTTYDYSGGYYDYADREFRGFEYMKTTAPDGTYTETWFHQDDIYKGLIKEQITRDSSGNIYTRSVNTYETTSPYPEINFPYLRQKDDYIYDGTSTPKQARIEFWYDDYGNIIKKYFHGDVSIVGDEREEYTEYNYDTTNWIVSLPVYTYVKDSDGVIRARTWFTYYPDTGNLWTKEQWLEGGTNPVTTYTYDSYGNIEIITDPEGNTTTMTYDTTTYTYPVTIQNPLGHTIQKTYDYRFGKVLTETDSNGNTTTYEYDEFGRIKKVTNPNDTNSTYGTISYYYLDFGTVGSQRVAAYATEQSGTGNYIWRETYFDGPGRTIKTRIEGPDSKVIVTETTYNNRGLVSGETLPYFEGIESRRWTTYEYDPVGRIITTVYPDSTYATSDYLRGTLTYIDPNGHKKVEEKDIYGRIIKIHEYTGDEASGFTLYATTTYEYDVLGNLVRVIDANGNQTVMTYDTLSRKISMDDPDMGHWEYAYDANGNLIWQKDAKGQEITFQYDALNRIIKKIYPDQTFIEYRYDETFSTNSTGRLTTVVDFSGTTKFYYDKLGNTIKTIKTVDGVDYITETTYDALGRTDTITYPDGTEIKYEYDTGGECISS
jgi:YD repeat-containing protein